MRSGTIVVTGSSRCGSSLTMRLLEAIGVEPYCDDESWGTSYETANAMRLLSPGNDEWWPDTNGKAVKILDAGRSEIHWPASGRIGFVYCTRIARHQAESQAKFMGAMVPSMGTASLSLSSPKAIRQLEMDNDHNARELTKRGEVIVQSFEDVIANPVAACRNLAQFAGVRWTPRIIAKAAALVHERDAKCMPGLGVEIRYARQVEGALR